MDLKGRIFQVMPVTSGTSKAGKDWSKQDFVIETLGQYPKKVALSVWGQQKIDDYDLQIGMEVTVHVELESREYNGKWYTEARAWKIEWSSEARRPTPAPLKGEAAREDKPSAPEKKDNEMPDFSDLPF